MPKRLLAIAGLLAATVPAIAVVTTHDLEQHGNKPFTLSLGGWKQVADVLNLPGRVYYRDKGSTGFGTDYHGMYAAYRGDAQALNQALKTLAEMPASAEAEVVLLPGAGAVFDRKRARVGCHWRARMVYVNIYDPKHLPPGSPSERFTVRLEVFLPEVADPAAPAAAELLQAWIAELDSDRFVIRDLALRQLAQQGLHARSAVHKALQGDLTAEQRRRLESLEGQLEVLRPADVRLPPGLRVLSFDQLLTRERGALVSKDPGAQWRALERLHDAVEGSDELMTVFTSLLSDAELRALQERSREAPKDYLLSFLPLVTQQGPPAAERAKQALGMRELRKKLDGLCTTARREVSK